MNRLSFVLVLVLAGSAFAPIGCAGCEDDRINPIGQGGMSVGGSGGSAGHGGAGGSVPAAWVPGEPGIPGEAIRLSGGIPFAQGLSKTTMIEGLASTMATDHCVGAGGTAGSGGAGGSTGAGGSAVSYCPSSYVPAEPTLDFSAIGETDLSIVLAAQPVFQPNGPDPGCAMVGAPISDGALYLGDCTGITAKLDLLQSDNVSFFGASTIFPMNTEVMLNGGPVRLISGSAISTASVGGKVFAVSNASQVMIQFEKDLEGVWQRTEIDLGSVGVSALMARTNGTLLFATHRTVEVESLYAAGFCVDPGSTLIEAEPIHLKTYDPDTGTIVDFVDIPSDPTNVSRVTAQNCSAATTDGGGLPLTCFIGGSANILAQAQDGDILFSDRLAGTVYKIAADGSSVTPLFTIPPDVLLSGLTEAPNGILYVVRSATSNFNCDAILSYPAILYWDETAQPPELVEWSILDDPEYDEVLPAVCNTGVVERSCPIDTNFLGGGLFVNITHDSQGNLIVTATVTGVTQAIPVVVPPQGAGGAGGTGGAGGAAGSGGSAGAGGS